MSKLLAVCYYICISLLLSYKEYISMTAISSVKHSELLPLIVKAKKYLKSSQTIINLFKENNLPIDYLDYIPVKFDKIDTSAKTVSGVIILSYKLLEDNDFYKDYSYLAHEITHFIQQCFAEEATESGDEHYLDNEYEIEGFQKQVEYLQEEFGPEEAEKYADSLLEYHEYKKNKRKQKKDELMANVNE